MADSRHMRDADARPDARPDAGTDTDTGTIPQAPAPAPAPKGRTPRRPSRAAMIAAPIALLATASTVAVGVVGSGAEPAAPVAREAVVEVAASLERPAAVSRAGSRVGTAVRGAALQQAFDRNARLVESRRATRKAVAAADTRLWTTVPLNLWTLPGKDAKKVGLLAEKRKVLVTGREAKGREEVVVKGRSRWVSAGYLAKKKPVEPKPAEPAEPADDVEELAEEAEEAAAPRAAATGACTNGTSVSAGVSPNVAAVHRAVCAAYPQITSYGDFRGDGEHAQGIALDIMVSGSLGWEIAEYLRANHAELGISYLIYAQKIWSVQRSGEGWRGMSDRGSTTANHYDHVHVTTY